MADPQSWMESSDVFPLFPTLVWKIQLRPALHGAIDAGVLGLLDRERRGQPDLKRGEAWQSAHSMHRQECLRELCGHVARAAQGVLQFLKIGDAPMEITGCWLKHLWPGRPTSHA